MTNNEYKQFYDVYGIEVIIESLKKDFKMVSYCKNSIPTEGSYTINTNRIGKMQEDGKIHNVICHRNGSITIETNYGFYKFLN